MGVKSARVGRVPARKGFEKVYNLAGGLRSWDGPVEQTK